MSLRPKECESIKLEYYERDSIFEEENLTNKSCKFELKLTRSNFKSSSLLYEKKGLTKLITLSLSSATSVENLSQVLKSFYEKAA